MNYFRKTKFRESSLIIVALFIAIVYTDVNKIREKIFFEAKSKGYTLVSYVNSKAIFWEWELMHNDFTIFFTFFADGEIRRKYIEIALKTLFEKNDKNIPILVIDSSSKNYSKNK